MLHRQAVEETYDGRCSIYEKHSRKESVSKVTVQDEEMVRENEPCHLSFSRTSPAGGTETTATVSQTIKLFLAPEIEIKPGSRIEVTQHGRTENYARSGMAAVYSSHQEILLEVWRGYA